MVNRYPAELLPANSLLFEFEHQFLCETSVFSDDQLLALLEEMNPKTVINKATLTLFVLTNRADLNILKTVCKQNNLKLLAVKEKYHPLETITVSSQVKAEYNRFCEELQKFFPTITFVNNLTNPIE